MPRRLKRHGMTAKPGTVSSSQARKWSSILHTQTVGQVAGPVTYEILHPEKKKSKQTYHINLLKEWKERSIQAPAKVLFVRKVEPEEEEEELEAGPEDLTTSASQTLVYLSSEEATQLLQTFKEVSSQFSASPGKTTVVEHVIRLKDGRPIRQRPYRVPQQLVGKLQDEIKEKLRLRVIEPSKSEWCSPVVIVFKKRWITADMHQLEGVEFCVRI